MILIKNGSVIENNILVKKDILIENNLIKKHKPKYNILLKDDKTYPYIRIDLKEDYPALTIVRKIKGDGAKYFGPYSGMSVVYGVMGTLERALGIPMCKRQFPKDIGKERPCLNYHIKKCFCARKKLFVQFPVSVFVNQTELTLFRRFI